MQSQELLVEREGAVALLRLNRPDKHNALGRRLSEDLCAALEALEADDGVKAVVITGAGERAFCAGADMAEQMADPDMPQATGRALARVLRFPKPTIAAVNGYAYGGGALLAINCDLRLASPNARFRFVGVSYGLVVGAAQLPRIVGLPRAKELVFTARVVEADEALRLGLVDRLVPQDKLLEEALALAQQIAAHPLRALMASKEVLDLAVDNRQALLREAEVNQALRQGEEHRELFRRAAQRVTGRDAPPQ
ncbi:MAG TPA: enoyl-CoA hydratase/isomerase family protein [Dehalococcoidia bacterium]|nr:enoyl-CoA hydratase/isomerase family protein [Dehalococcoidia bacterium]